MELTLALNIMLGMLLIVNISLLIVLIGLTEHFGVQFKRIPFPWRKMRKDEIMDNTEDENSAEVVEELSASEEARLERNKRDEKMEKRLRAIKEELDEKNGILRRGTIAVEEHPQVKNLPHDAVNAYGNPDAEEYAE